MNTIKRILRPIQSIFPSSYTYTNTTKGFWDPCSPYFWYPTHIQILVKDSETYMIRILRDPYSNFRYPIPVSGYQKYIYKYYFRILACIIRILVKRSTYTRIYISYIYIDKCRTSEIWIIYRGFWGPAYNIYHMCCWYVLHMYAGTYVVYNTCQDDLKDICCIQHISSYVLYTTYILEAWICVAYNTCPLRRKRVSWKEAPMHVYIYPTYIRLCRTSEIWAIHSGFWDPAHHVYLSRRKRVSWKEDPMHVYIYPTSIYICVGHRKYG